MSGRVSYGFLKEDLLLLVAKSAKREPIVMEQPAHANDGSNFASHTI